MVLKLAQRGTTITHPISGKVIPNITINNLQLLLENYFPDLKPKAKNKPKSKK
jgi:hypothetical protein